MFIAFFESFKYMGHLWPIALLRVYVGYFFLHAGIHKIQEGVLSDPAFQTTLQKWITDHPHNQAFVTMAQTWLVNHWQMTSEALVIAQIVVGICFILGFMVRPAALIAIVLSMSFMASVGSEAVTMNKIFIVLNGSLFLVAAGRCFGFDYYFYKRVRGIWW
jgi:thiosulfate dehydrogenase [quinone] large subunit